MKRQIALICLAVALLMPCRMSAPAAANAGDMEPADAVTLEPSSQSGNSLAAGIVYANEVAASKRMASIALIRTKYEGSAEIDMLAKLIYREARGVKSDTEKAAVVWCVLNRVDDTRHPNTIKKVITQKHQFAWRYRTPIKQEFKDLALDVVIRWELEKLGYADVGRVLPSGYLFFAGRHGHNWFRNVYRSRNYWDWSTDSPYDGNGVLLSNVPVSGAS